MIELADLADIHYVRQGEPLGLGHAVSVARKHVGNNPFVVLLGDDIMHQRSHLLKDMIATYEETGASTVALMEVEPSAISAYGCAAPEDRQGPLCNIVDVVEKPKAEDAPSNLAIVGRYLFTPAIFDAIEQVQPGVGGEIQLTDAIGLLLKDEPVKGQIFEEGRFDIGNKIEYLRATVELALERDDLGPEFRHVLSEIIKRHGIV